MKLIHKYSSKDHFENEEDYARYNLIYCLTKGEEYFQHLDRLDDPEIFADMANLSYEYYKEFKKLRNEKHVEMSQKFMSGDSHGSEIAGDNPCIGYLRKDTPNIPSE